MTKPLRVLLVEDSERDAALVKLYLRRGGFDATVHRVETAEEMAAVLQAEEFDIIISDLNLPHFTARAALAVLQQSGRPIPLIVLTGDVDRRSIDGLLDAGAAQVLFKYEMSQVAAVIERAVQGGS